MNARIEDFGTGWFGIILALKSEEIDALVDKLQKLKAGTTSHFHFRSDFTADGGVGDVEITLQSASPDNMTIE